MIAFSINLDSLLISIL